jgi:hypothetical protein
MYTLIVNNEDRLSRFLSTKSAGMMNRAPAIYL